MINSKMLTVVGSLLIVGYLSLTVMANKIMPPDMTTSRSDSVTGLSLVSDAYQKHKGEAAGIIGKAILQKEVIADFSTLVIASPIRKISHMEAVAIADWVKDGGNLYVSYHKEEHWENLLPLFSEMGLESSPGVNGNFQNNQVQVSGVESDGVLFKQGEVYAGYSKERFRKSTLCKNMDPCFVSEEGLGSGVVFLNLGLPFFANGLIGLQQNKLIAARLLDFPGKLAFDEYHQFFHDKTTADLLFHPSVLFPLVGFLIVFILFFIFGDRDEFAYVQPHEGAKSRTYHEFNLGLMARKASLFSMADGYASYLQRKFQINLSSPEEKKIPVERFKQLLHAHRQSLELKGMKPYDSRIR